MGVEMHQRMFRSGGRSVTRKTPVFSSQPSSIYTCIYDEHTKPKMVGIRTRGKFKGYWYGLRDINTRRMTSGKQVVVPQATSDAHFSCSQIDQDCCRSISY
ncbi:hypothetical protein TNCV_1030111 [Trichonephila clavipes]|nr:hypothetical protein TNCV_1030111 [Trichonephila clavipes]